MMPIFSLTHSANEMREQKMQAEGAKVTALLLNGRSLRLKGNRGRNFKRTGMEKRAHFGNSLVTLAFNLIKQTHFGNKFI